MELEFIPLSFSRFVIKIGKREHRGLNPGSGGFHVEQARYKETMLGVGLGKG